MYFTDVVIVYHNYHIIIVVPSLLLIMKWRYFINRMVVVIETNFSSVAKRVVSLGHINLKKKMIDAKLTTVNRLIKYNVF